MHDFNISREHASPRVARIVLLCETNDTWRVEHMEAYYDKLRKRPMSPDEAYTYTLARARNLAEQKIRRLSHGTGAT